MRTILQGLLALLAFLLPFEVRRPVLSLAPYMVFTGLELVTLLAVSVWGAQAVFRRRLPTLPGGLGVLVWALAGIALLSAATAPAFRAESLKFTLRMVTGICVCHALVMASSPGFTSLLIRALVAGAAISSALGIWTCLRPDQTAWLTPLFREREFLIGAVVRMSGTFEYPNIAAAFLAMTFALSLAYIPTQGARDKGQGTGEKNPLSRFSFPLSPYLWAGLQGLIFLGLIMTLSRAGIAVALFGLCLVMAVHGIRFYRMRWEEGRERISAIPLILVRSFLPTLTVTALCLVGGSLFYPPFLLRLWTGEDRAWYSARYETLDAVPLSAGGGATVRVRVTNTGHISWSPKGAHPFRLSYHWMEARTEKAIPAPQARTELPGEIPPGQSVTLMAQVLAPPVPGDYLLSWDMVHERATWFSQKGCPPGRVPVRVGEAAGAPFAGWEETPPDPTALEAESVSRGTLWRAGWAMFRRYPVLGVGPDNFRRLWGREFGMGRWDERVHSNNLFIEMMVTTGLLGGLTFLALILWVLRAQARLLMSDTGFALAAALFGATAAFLAHGTVDCFIAFTPIYLLFWGVVGMTGGMEKNVEGIG